MYLIQLLFCVQEQVEKLTFASSSTTDTALSPSAANQQARRLRHAERENVLSILFIRFNFIFYFEKLNVNFVKIVVGAKTCSIAKTIDRC